MNFKNARCLSIDILLVSQPFLLLCPYHIVLHPIVHSLLFDVRKLHEVVWSMQLVVVLLGILQHKLVLHVLVMPEPLEVVVPGADGDHEEAVVLVGEQHLYLLVEERGVVDVAFVPILSSSPPEKGLTS